MNEWLEILQKQLTGIDWIQWGALIFGITEVLLARANSIWLYPAGILATVLAVISFFDAQLYAECLLQGYYIGMSLYGWWYWTAKIEKPLVKTSFTTKSEWMVVAAIIFGGWMLLYFVLIEFTPSTVPAWDAWITSTAWAGTWLLARRKVENWLLLNVSNIFAIPLMFKKNLPLFAILTVFLFVVACIGYGDWKKTASADKMNSI